jgi:cytochrome c-type biogenesis protein CcmH
MQRLFRSAINALLLLSLFAMAQPLLAQDSVVTDDEVNEVAKDVYCPVCENTPLDVCATQACADWRELIRTKLGEGQSKEEIFDYFGRQYGDGVLANPPNRGVSLIILWVLPVVLLLIGALIFSRYMRNLRASSATAPVSEAPTNSQAESDMTASATNHAAADNFLKQIEEEVGKSK